MDFDSLIILASVGFTAVVGFVYARRVRRREQADQKALAEAQALKLDVPPSLHPVIDPDVCMGSYSCLEACPEGEVLGLVDGQATLIAGASCIGHGKCALECPVGAIRLVFGSSHRGVDLPDVDEHFESSRPGVHVVGELGGMGLIKNALRQGMEVAQTLAKRLGKSAGGELVDVAIVGAGPAGLATALGCSQAGLSYRVLEQDTVGGTIAHYPRQKIVMTEAVKLPGFGRFGKRLISKEELLEAVGKMIRRSKLTIDEGVKVLGIAGGDGAFTVNTSKGALKARKVVLATGRRGSPRKLGVPGEELPKVAYRLIDPAQYQNARVLVVGGGDSAVEAAIQLAKETNAKVTLSYRGEALARCREANRAQFNELVSAGRIKALLPSEVQQISENKVVLKSGQKQGAIANDFVIVSIGGELPAEFLKAAGVGMRRFYGEALGDTANEGPEGNASVPRKNVNQLEHAEAQKSRRMAFSLFVVGVLIIAGLWVVGSEYYLLPKAERLHSPMHELLKPAGLWGHGVGIAATIFMLSNFLYAVRKRWSLLKGYSTIRRWLTFHMFVGFMSPLVIVFHAAFQSNNLLATGTFASVLVVVATGMFGRFVFGLVPTRDGRAEEYSDLVARWERMKNALAPLLSGISNRAVVESLLSLATAPPPKGTLLGLFVSMPGQYLRRKLGLRRIKRLFANREAYHEFRDAFGHLVRVRTQVGFYRSLRRLLSIWKLLHVVLAVFLVIAIAAHIGLSLYLGYAWIYS